MSSTVLEWYENVRTRVLDLVGDYVGKEPFLIEGDSLLLECFEDQRLDFNAGFQLLHAVYIVEAQLENLVKRRCNFSIVFFDAHAELCIPSSAPKSARPRYLLARSIIYQHLESRLHLSHPGLEIHRFPTYDCLAFRQYLETAGIYMVMCHDGSKVLSDKYKAANGISESMGAENHSALKFREFIYWLTLLGFTVALVNEVEWRDRKVITRVVEGDRRQEQQIRQDMSNNAQLSHPDISSINPTMEPSKPLQDLLLHHGTKFSERDYLTIFCLSKMLSSSSTDASLASALLLQLSCLKHLSVGQRRMKVIRFSDKGYQIRFEEFLTDFSITARLVVNDTNWREIMKEHDILCDVDDLIDGRLLRSILNVIEKGLAKPLQSGPIGQDFEMLSAALRSMCKVNLSLQERPATLVTDVADEVDQNHIRKSNNVLPFSNPTFAKHLTSIHISIDESTSSISRDTRPVVSREISHWHNAKRSLDPKKSVAAPKPTSRRWNPLRSNQKYMAEMTAYSASLTNSKGKVLTPEIISVSAVKATTGPSVAKKEQKGKTESKSTKSTSTSKADRIIAENKAKKEKVDSSRTFAAWETMRQQLDKLDSEHKYLEAGAYLNRLESTKADILRVDVQMYRLQALLYWWASFCKDSRKDEGYSIVALMWDIIRGLGTSASRESMTKEAAVRLDEVCSLLKLPQLDMAAHGGDRPLSFRFTIPIVKPTLSIDMPPKEFQLNHCGPYMDRNLDARVDPRVTSFEPDGWQRKVLDELDANNSIFVVAPTSAGKTFISFYAMEQVLRGSNEGILVYVAPTKALVNQIAAEIHGRFSKTYPHAGHSVWAIHTRDYRINNPSGCQILVTVPHILQIMLLAPSNARSWSPRVKRIIFDEIHSIGQAEDGVVWEQLLLLAPCQIIALSATVGNPEEFNEWLASTQKSAGIELTMIQHKHRYSDLRKSVFSPPKQQVFRGFKDIGPSTGLLGLDRTANLKFFHPVASLVNKTRGLPDDLTLEARDCLSLWKCMVKHQTEKFPIPPALNPDNALPPFIKKVDVFVWEAALKEILVEWMGQSDSPFDDVLEDLSTGLYRLQSDHARGIVGLLNETYISDAQAQGVSEETNGTSTPEDLEVIDSNDLRSTTLPLLVQLHERNALPAILFNYDRLLCEQIAEAVLVRLETAENRFKNTSLEWKTMINGFEEWKKVEEAKKARKGNKGVEKKKKKKGKGGSDDEAGDLDDPVSKSDSLRDSASEEKHSFASFDPNEPLRQFSFADNKKYERSSLKEDLRVLEWKGLPAWLGEALKRGIGIHHAGMNRKYRQIVEVLFRKGYLRVVIATGTLALGINMPCTTVVFSGDSVFLTALNFRQAAGRAGRRGFDLLGNVVFQGISMNKICRLLSSRLPDLNGHFPITTTLVLRLFALLHDSDTSPYAVKAINSLLSQPRLYLGGESFKAQVLHHLRFSIEYLRKQALLGLNGEPINFANCVSHLYYTENSSFAFHALLRGGYFHDLCTNRNPPAGLMRTLMIVMAHLFGRRPCRNVQQEYIDMVVKRSPSVVFLPPMPEKAAGILSNHNKETLCTFSTYVETYAAQHLNDEEKHLPLTQTNAGGEGNQEAAAALGASYPTRLRSAFVALSGHGDDFESISDLCNTVRSGVFLEEAVVPHLEVYPEETKSPLNAYLYDFYSHGSLEPLEVANGIRKSDVWFLLNDFSMVLATIVTSFANFLHLKEAQDLDMTTVAGSGDVAEIDADEKLTDELDAAGPTPPVNNNNKLKQTAPSSKPKVEESWDDGDDDDDDDEASSDSAKVGDRGGASLALDDEGGLLQVYKAFVKLRAEFDEKFIAIGA